MSPKTDDFEITIHAFYCGHGDTLLIEIPGPRRIMIDCHLTPEVERSIFGFFEDHKIQCLDYLFLTHFDLDHFQGMWRVVEYFSAKGRKLCAFGVGGGENSARLAMLVARREGQSLRVREFRRLTHTLRPHLESGAVKVIRFGSGGRIIFPAGSGYPICLVPIAPDASVAWLENDGAFERALAGGAPGLDPNVLSAAMVLAAGHKRCTLALLPGDLTRGQCARALVAWEATRNDELPKLAPWVDRSGGFDLVKVPHHGSIKSHDPALCERLAGRAQIAMVSVGSQYAVLPDKRVLTAYMHNGFVVLATCRRAPRPVYSRLLDLTATAAPGTFAYARQTVKVTIPNFADPAWEPPAAEITPGEIELYAEARD